MKSNKKAFAALLSMLLLLLLLPVSAIDAMSITVVCKDGDKPIVGAELELFLVAKQDSSGAYIPTEDFAKYNVKLDSRTLAYTLEGAVRRDELTPIDSIKTDAGGYAVFPSETVVLEPGLYLVLAKKHIQDARTYSFSPFTLTLDGGSVNIVSVSAKYESETIPLLPQTVTRKVLKVWNDSGEESQRPREITVTLLKDGEIYDTVVLSDENSWRHTWDKLDASAIWTVAENELEDYTVSISREGITFVITNTYSEDTPDPPSDTTAETTIPHEDTTSPESSETTQPEQSDTAPESDNTTDSPETTLPESIRPSSTTEPEVILPQTGQLRTPIPILIAAGLALMISGIICLKGGLGNDKD